MRLRLSVATKLYSGFAVILALLVVVALIAAGQLKRSADTTDQEMYRHNMLPMQYALRANAGEKDASINEKRALLRDPGTPERVRFIRLARDGMSVVEEWSRKYAATDLRPDERQTWEQVLRMTQQVHADRARLLYMLAAGNREDAAFALSQDVTTETESLAYILNQAVDQQTSGAEMATASVLEAARQARGGLLFVSLLATVLGGGIAFWLGRSISRNVNRMKAAAQGIALGDLDQDLDVRSRDEIGEMAVAFEEMIASLTAAAETAERIAGGDLTVRV